MNDLYSLVSTSDGSSTVRAEEFGESMHTEAGAYEESVIKHVRACGKIVSGKASLSVLDVGFGIGYNLCALLNEWSVLENPPYLSVVSLEKDSSVAVCFNTLNFNDERDRWYDVIKKGFREGSVKGDGFEIVLLFGDARKSILQLTEKPELFDVIFQDAFSPGKNPELWSLDYFRVLRKLIKNDGVMTTYSAAPQIRRAMLEAGFRIARGVSTGKKKEGTVASPYALEDELNSSEIEELLHAVKSTMYRDENLNDCRDIILSRRIEEMAEIRKCRLFSQCHRVPQE
jgi:chorismate dehydratase